MRQLEYLSYSGLSLWESRPDEFYLTRLCERREPREPQEKPAAAGSAFDAYVKSFLHRALFGDSNPQFEFQTLFEAQVEPQNRDWAIPVGQYIFHCYKLSGFYDELLDMLKQSKEPPRFEFEVQATLNGVPFLGKPDACWVTPRDVHVIHDFKVSGFASKYTTSPCKGYRICRDGFVGKQSRGAGKEHREYLGLQYRDIEINTSYMEASNDSWADQLSLYGWALGEKIGDENVVLSIHQIVAKPVEYEFPQLRVAEYHGRVAAGHQHALAARLKRCWDALQSGHIFADLSREESDLQCQALDDVALGMMTDGSSREDFFNDITRSRYMG